MVDSPIHQHIRAVLQYEEDYKKREEALLADYEAKGHTVIDGSLVLDGDWEVTDYRTGDIIAAGGDGVAGYAEVADDHGEMWVHIDLITDQLTEIPLPITPGVPEALCEVLTEWARTSASDEDIALVLGED
ncbi:hypothetical protein ACIRPH_05235 [Nocardiopsis sp. NPDC101807]|uniref:hypothetical protein n=1 Tax=Nocardiopsis sp. NPDC101807 TaxID=3364339 RepID=UPI0037F7C8EE